MYGTAHLKPGFASVISIPEWVCFVDIPCQSPGHETLVGQVLSPTEVEFEGWNSLSPWTRSSGREGLASPIARISLPQGCLLHAAAKPLGILAPGASM